MGKTILIVLCLLLLMTVLVAAAGLVYPPFLTGFNHELPVLTRSLRDMVRALLGK